MRELVESTAAHLDRQLVELAVEIGGSAEEGRRLLAGLARGPLDERAKRFVASAGALLRARSKLGLALDELPLPDETPPMPVLRTGTEAQVGAVAASGPHPDEDILAPAAPAVPASPVLPAPRLVAVSHSRLADRRGTCRRRGYPEAPLRPHAVMAPGRDASPMHAIWNAG